MRRAFPPAVAAIATVLVLSAVSASGHASTASGGSTVVVSAQSTSFNTAGSGLGAVTTFTDDLYSHGTKVGRDQVVCTATGPGSILECLGTDLLPKGEVVSSGPFDPAHQTHLEVGILGGTGAYRDARGVIDIKLISQTKSTYTYHFDR